MDLYERYERYDALLCHFRHRHQEAGSDALVYGLLFTVYRLLFTVYCLLTTYLLLVAFVSSAGYRCHFDGISTVKTVKQPLNNR